MEILFFYNSYNEESLRTKSIFTQFAENNPNELNLRFSNFDVAKNPSICKEYDIHGVPTTLVLRNKIAVYRHLGQLNESELKIMIDELYSSDTGEEL